MQLFILLSVLLSTGLQQTPGSEDLIALGLRLAGEQKWAQAEDAFRRAAAADPSSADPYLELGRLLMTQEKTREALNPLDQALRLKPGLPAALFLRGLALMQLGMLPEAVLELETALEKDPDNAANRRALAVANLKAGEPGGALRALGPLVEESSEDVDPAVLAMYGAALAELGRNEEALAPLEDSLAIEPNQPQALIYLGQALQDLNRHLEAMDVLRKGIDLPPPQDARFILGLAESEFRLEHRTEARERTEELLTRYPRFARAWFLKGLIDAEEQDYRSAAVSFEKAIELGHRPAEAYLNLGMALASEKDTDAAISNFDHALEKDPSLAAAHYYKGILLFRVGEHREAVLSLEEAVSLEPNEPRTHLALAEVYLQLGRINQALEAAEKASQSPELAPRAFYWKGLAHHLGVQYPEAVVAYREAIARGFDSAEIYLNLGRALYAMAEEKQAEAVVKVALERAPDEGETHLLMGKIQQELQQYDLALEHLERATALLPESADAWYRSGVVKARQGRLVEAISDWRKALEYDPELIDVYYRLGSALVRTGQREAGQELLAEFQRRSSAADREEHHILRLKAMLRRALDLTDQGQDDEALTIFNEAIELDPLNALPYLTLADFFALRGRAAEAEEILLRGIEQIPEHLSLHEALLSVYQATGNREGAQAERRRIEAIHTMR